MADVNAEDLPIISSPEDLHLIVVNDPEGTPEAGLYPVDEIVTPVGDNIIQQRGDSSSSPAWKTEFTGTLDSDDQDVMQHLINGTVRSWLNEWGALRGRNPYSSWSDALVRAVIQGSDYRGTGFALEIDDRTVDPGPLRNLWGRRWADGNLVRHGNIMADVYVCNESDSDETIEALNLPDGTVVIELVGE